MVFVGGESLFSSLFHPFIFSSSLGVECGGLWGDCGAWAEPDICEALMERQVGPSETQTMGGLLPLGLLDLFPLGFLGLLLLLPGVSKSSRVCFGEPADCCSLSYRFAASRAH